ncbi:MAG: osmotically inducible protein OsmC, partial [Phaeodactylibacter sp.]|nr:osmotically inducible protein OsmC [Phaeodactylibacter sp.]
VFVKFNCSHYGLTPEQPTEFEDLEAFAENNYSKELLDLDSLMAAFFEGQAPIPVSEINLQQIALIGHSRGGGLAIVRTVLDTRIRALITWAAVDRLDNLWKDPVTVEKWKENGQLLLHNSRTGQLMPLHIQLYQDYEFHKDRYTLELQAPKVAVPWLILHGTKDPTIPPAAAHHLHRLQPNSKLELIEEADHVFGGRHPWPDKEPLSITAQLLVDKTLGWLKALNG